VNGLCFGGVLAGVVLQLVRVLVHVHKGGWLLLLKCAFHMFLMVTLPNPQENEEARYLVDVGLPHHQRFIILCGTNSSGKNVSSFVKTGLC